MIAATRQRRTSFLRSGNPPLESARADQRMYPGTGRRSVQCMPQRLFREAEMSTRGATLAMTIGVYFTTGET